MDRVPKTINIIPTIFIFLSFITIFGNIATNVFVYALLRGLARNLANKNRIENPRGFS